MSRCEVVRRCGLCTAGLFEERGGEYGTLRSLDQGLVYTAGDGRLCGDDDGDDDDDDRTSTVYDELNHFEMVGLVSDGDQVLLNLSSLVG